MGKEQFIGSWKLVSSEFRTSDGDVSYPLGKDAVGLIMYDNKGYVSAQIMRPDRPNFASSDHLKGTPAEMKSAFEGYVAYYGTYEVDEKKRTIAHHLQASLFPNWVGTIHERFYEFFSNRLTLTTPPMPMGGKEVVGLLIWERAD